MLIFGGKSVRWSQTPSPLAYAVYAFITVDNCERPLSQMLDLRTFLTILEIVTWEPFIEFKSRRHL